MPDGILIIDKPAGMTSHDVVAILRGILKTKRIGHTGTLDPFATGVLVMMIGKATRLARFLDQDLKEYEAALQFGWETDTGDLTGTRRESRDISAGEIRAKLNEIVWDDVFDAFRGEIEQTPPMYSAKKVDGKKLYELARRGIEIEREPVRVEISLLELIPQPKSADSQIAVRVECSAGTYIRTLAEDIGRKIGVGAHLAELRRTRAGKFESAKAVTIKHLERIVADNTLEDILIPMNEAVSHLPEHKISPIELKMIMNGRKIEAHLNEENGTDIRLTHANDGLIAIGKYHDNEIQPRLVFS